MPASWHESSDGVDGKGNYSGSDIIPDYHWLVSPVRNKYGSYIMFYYDNLRWKPWNLSLSLTKFGYFHIIS